MARKDWDKIADDQFNSMPVDFQDAWSDLRSRVKKR